MNTRLFYQCINCGGCTNRTKPLKFATFGKDIESEFSNNRFEEWITNRKEQGRFLAQELRTINYLNSKKYKYDQYMSSIGWKEKRKLVLERDKNLCQGCKSAPAQEIHHLTYERVFNEPLEDLIALCNDCHEKEHKNPFLNITQKRTVGMNEELNSISPPIHSTWYRSTNDVI